jgi:hypothetical protein
MDGTFGLTLPSAGSGCLRTPVFLQRTNPENCCPSLTCFCLPRQQKAPFAGTSRDGSDGTRTRDLPRDRPLSGRNMNDVGRAVPLFMRFLGSVLLGHRVVEPTIFGRLLPDCCPDTAVGDVRVSGGARPGHVAAQWLGEAVAGALAGASSPSLSSWEHPRPVRQQLRAAERLAVLGRVPPEPPEHAPPRVRLRTALHAGRENPERT